MIEFTEAHRAKLEEYLASHTLPRGLGDNESACSVAAINLAMSGELTDDIPPCMSLALGRAVITLQDAMPDDMRNSKRYRDLVLNMPGTGREREQDRADILLAWMWEVVLPTLQGLAHRHGFGDEWAKMLSERSSAAADAARAAADAAADAARAARAAARAARAAARAADAADAADAAADAARAAALAAAGDFWVKVEPVRLLERATYLGEAA